MNADELKARQTPLKEVYRKEPHRARWTLSARGTVDIAQQTCRVETGHGRVVAGLHAATGGTGDDACSGDMLLESLAACAGVTLSAVATAMGIALRSARVFVEGDVDFRGTLGIDKSVPVGFSEIRMRFVVDSEADEASLATLLKLTERYCVIFQTLRQPSQLSAGIERVGGPESSP
jgi:uncharacterized OsmC-like protein